MTDRLTCCPHCDTSFRITEEQLQSAKGAVRCGSCLRVFKAAEHLLAAPENAAQQPADAQLLADTAIPAPQPEGEQESSTDDTAPATAELQGLPDEDSLESLLLDGDIDLGELDEELDEELEDLLSADDFKRIDDTQSFGLGEINEIFAARGRFGEHRGALFDRQLKVVDCHSEQHADESWAVHLLEELQSEEDRSQQAHRTAMASATRPGVDSATSFNLQSGLNSHTAPSSQSDLSSQIDLSSQTIVGQFYAELEQDGNVGHDNSYVNLTAITDQLPGNSTGEELAQLDDWEETVEAAPLTTTGRGNWQREPASALATPLPGSVEQAPAGKPAAAELIDAKSADSKLDDTHAPSTQEAHAPINPAGLVRSIGASPVELEGQPAAVNWRSHLLWACLSLLAAAALAGQLIWQNFDDLSQRPSWRYWFSQVCPLAGCELNPLLAPGLIKASNLIVRSHPQRENALIIDSILLNTASFQQPFPDFQLSFSNLQGEILGQRQFTPSEYLRGELAGVTSMPSGQPIHITLEIVDPGPDAVNYSASIPLSPAASR
ncbi:MAG: DUF3426 domain-containing protein [Gammaproteobacteria bacterium]|nr:DUF3426 domain-containing protein [Gammaproteobacteria bacterium]